MRTSDCSLASWHLLKSEIKRSRKVRAHCDLRDSETKDTGFGPIANLDRNKLR